MLHAMVAPQLDDVNPPTLDIQRLARLAARAEEDSRAPSPLSDQLPLTDAGVTPAAGASRGGGPADHEGGGHSNGDGQAAVARTRGARRACWRGSLSPASYHLCSRP